jgi:hypothetical protein
VLLVGCGGGLDPTGRVERVRGPCQQVEQFQHFGALAAGVLARHLDIISRRDSAGCCAVQPPTPSLAVFVTGFSLLKDLACCVLSQL